MTLSDKIKSLIEKHQITDKQLIRDIVKLSKESYIQGSDDCHKSMKEQ